MRRVPHRPFRVQRHLSSAVIPVFSTLILTAMILAWISSQFRPLVETITVSNAINQITLAVGNSAADSLLSLNMDYSGFVDIVTNTDGEVTSLSMKVAEGNEYKREFINCLYSRLGEIERHDLTVPVGNLTGILWLSALGPDIRVAVRSVGDISVDYANEFTSVGINQTRHAVYLCVTVAIQLMIPGEIIPVIAEEKVCIAETVIVGEVPGTYLNLQDGDN